MPDRDSLREVGELVIYALGVLAIAYIVWRGFPISVMRS